jgi:hypothetical protein
MIDSKYLLNDDQAIDRIFTHIDNGTTDLGDTIWKEPVENYYSLERFNAEIALYVNFPFLIVHQQHFLRMEATLPEMHQKLLC